jgi:hypothetical protein
MDLQKTKKHLDEVFLKLSIYKNWLNSDNAEELPDSLKNEIAKIAEVIKIITDRPPQKATPEQHRQINTFIQEFLDKVLQYRLSFQEEE